MARPASDQLWAHHDRDDPYDYQPEQVASLQLEAVRERFLERRTQMKVLDARASETGIDDVQSISDVVPLLFAHTSYKSYPESLMAQGRWESMSRWLDTLSSVGNATEIDVRDVSDVDDWLAALHRGGHFAFSSSGTTGKCSFLDQTAGDREITRRTMLTNIGWATGLQPMQDRPVFLLGPSRSFHRFVEAFNAAADCYGREGDVYYLSDVPATVAETNRQGALRRAIAEGTALPSEISAVEQAAAERQKMMHEALLALVDAVIEHRHEPMVIVGMWAQYLAIAEEAKARGIGEGEFNPETVIMTGGGRKGAALPEDYAQQVQRFFGLDPSRFVHTYGMSEMSATFPLCASRRYHCPPWVVPLLLDKAGEHLMERGSEVVGRMGFFDTTIQGRWGGLVSGDRVTAHFDTCPCGRGSPTVSTVDRYTDLAEGDDKLTCAGTIDSYVRGEVNG